MDFEAEDAGDVQAVAVGISESVALIGIADVAPGRREDHLTLDRAENF
jgi:hypothetical protein